MFAPPPVLRAMREDSDKVPSLLTDYILKGNVPLSAPEELCLSLPEDALCCPLVVRCSTDQRDPLALSLLCNYLGISPFV